MAVVLNVIVTLQFGARIANDPDLLNRPSIIWGNFAILAVFVTCVALAVRYRRRPEIHKRLMLLAGISMTPPALARFPLWWPVLEGIVTDFGVIVLLVLALVVYDLQRRRRIERTTLVGGVSLVGLHYLASVVAASEFGVTFVRSFG